MTEETVVNPSTRRVIAISFGFSFALVAAIVIALACTTGDADANTYATTLSGAGNWTSAFWTCTNGGGGAASCTGNPYPGSGGVDGDTANVSSGSGGSLTVNTTIPNAVTLNLSTNVLGTVDVATGGTLTLFGTSTVSKGTLSVSGGTLSLPSPATLDFTFTGTPTSTFTLNSGTLTAGGTMTLNGSATTGTIMNWNGGTIGGAGLVKISLPTDTIKAQLNLQGTNGVMALNGFMQNNGNALFTSSTNALVLGAGASFSNLSTGQFNISSDAPINGASTSVFTNAGGLTKSGIAATTFALPFNNSGTVSFQVSSAGALSFSGGGTNSGAYNYVFPGTLSFSGSSPVTTFNSGTSFVGSPAVQFLGPVTIGTNLSFPANLSNSNAVTFSGASADVVGVAGSFTQASTGNLLMRINGPTAGSQYDQLNITGTASLAGTLTESLGYSPANGDTYDPIAFSGGNLGSTFGAISMPPNPNGTWTISYVPSAAAATAIQITAVSLADIAVTKTGPASIPDGTNAVYTVTVTNNGPSAATGIAIQDTFTGGTFVSAPGCSGGFAAPVTCNVAALGVGASQTFTITIAPSGPGTLSNSATRNASAPGDNNAANDTSTVNTTVTPVADLSWSGLTSTPASTNAGTTVTYSATLTDLGPDASSSTSVTFGLAGGGTITSVTGPAPFTCGGATCTAASIPINTPFTFTITATAPNQAGTITLTAVASQSASTPDPSPDPNPDSASVSTTINAITDITVSKSGPPTATAGQNVTYTIGVTNNGPSDAQNVVVSDPAPAGLTFVSATSPCAAGFPCTIPTVFTGTTTTFTATYAVAASATGTINNTVNVTTTTPESNTGNNSATASTAIATSADLAVTKTGPAAAAPGSTIVYTTTIVNNGPSDSTNFIVNDPTPANLTFVSATGACASFPCTLSLAAGATATINATYTVAAGATGSTTNTASVTPFTLDPVSGNNSSSVTTSFSAAADLSITKSAPATVVAGSTVTFNIVVTNNGPSTASNVLINDTPTGGLTFVSAIGACTTFPCTIPTMANGASASIAAKYKIAANATTIKNTADVTSSTADSNTANNTAVVIRTVQSSCPSVAPQLTNPVDQQTNVPLSGTIQWTNVGAVNYDVYLGLSGSGCSTLLGSTNGLSFNYSGLQPNTDYQARVVASSPGCNPAAPLASLCITFHTAQGCAVGTPSIIAPQDGTTVISPVNLQWNAVPGATGYHVIVNVNGNPAADLTTTSTSAQVNVGNGSIDWSVAAIGGNCTGTPATGRFTVCSPPAPPLAGVVGAPTSGHAYQVIVVKPDPNNTKYDYQEATNEQFTDAVTQTTTNTSVTYQHDAGTSASVFFYRVRAYNGCTGGPGGFSKTIRVVVLPATVSTRPVLNVPAGTKDLVIEQIFIPGLASPASFTATADKPWVVKIVPSFGTLTPAGETLNVYIDPSQLPNGTFTATIIVVTTPLTSGHLTTNGNTTTTAPVTINLVTPVVPVDPSAPATNALVIPAVGHLIGINSQWRSDIRVFNASSQGMSYLLSFMSAASPDVKQTTINTAAGDTTALDDIIHNWYGFGEIGDNASGVLQITPLSDSGTPNPLDTIISSRTYNLSNLGGTLGQFIPAVPLSQFVGSGGAHLSMQQIAQSQQFRTNFGLVEASGQAVNVLLSMFRSDGTKLFDLPVLLNAFEQKQLNGLLAQQGITDLADGRMEVQVSGGDGKVTAYASVVDNSSQDPLFVPGEPLANAAKNLYVMPGVADLNNGAASWRTDMRIFNSGATPQTTTLTFYPEQGQGNPLNATVTVNPGEVKVLDNVLQSTFAAQNVGGAVHLATPATSQLVVTGRTYNQTAGGTLGQFIPAATLDEAMSAGSRGLNILQVEDSMRYRTNVGLAEMSGQSATVEIGVVLPDSKVTPTIQIPLGPNEFKQFPLSALGLGDVYNVRVTMRVIDGGGHVTGYGSVIDETTNAPTYVAAQ